MRVSLGLGLEELQASLPPEVKSDTESPLFLSWPTPREMSLPLRYAAGVAAVDLTSSYPFTAGNT